MSRAESWIYFLLAIPLLSSNGCTVLGYSIGHNVDRGSRTGVRVDCEDPALAPGRRVRLSLNDGRQIEGRLLETHCDADPIMLVEVTRLNRADTVDTVRIATIDRAEVQTKSLTGTLAWLGFATDMAVLVAIAQAYRGIGAGMQ